MSKIFMNFICETKLWCDSCLLVFRLLGGNFGWVFKSVACYSDSCEGQVIAVCKVYEWNHEEKNTCLPVIYYYYLLTSQKCGNCFVK